MTGEWTPLDVDYFTNPVMVEAGPDGKLLHLAACCYAQKHTTDGVIPAAVVPVLLAQAPAKRATVRRLVELGRWLEVDGGFRIRDWHDWNDPAEVVEERKRKARERQRKWRQSRGRDASRNASRDGAGHGAVTGSTSPSPSQARTSSSSTGTHGPDPQPVDDDEDARIGQVLGLVADRRCAEHGKTGNRRYRARVLANLRSEEQLDASVALLLQDFPGAPADVLAASLLGEDARNLAHYRRSA